LGTTLCFARPSLTIHSNVALSKTAATRQQSHTGIRQQKAELLRLSEGRILAAEHVSGGTQHSMQQGLAGRASRPSFSPPLCLAAPPPSPLNTARLCLFHQYSPMAQGQSNE